MKSPKSVLLLAVSLTLIALIGCVYTPTPAPTQKPGIATPTPIHSESQSSPLDEMTLKRLELSIEKIVEMRPGETHTFSLGVVECCYWFRKVTPSATWSVNPTQGARIDPGSGILTVENTILNGSVFTVSANVENGRRIVSVNVHIYTPEANPLVDVWWTEDAQFACGTPREVIPEERIGELRFRADGTFDVTWHPFEVYHDYWGTYKYDLKNGTLGLTVTRGNYVPARMDGTGQFSIDRQGRLILWEMWLGSPKGSTAPANCGHRFTRLH